MSEQNKNKLTASQEISKSIAVQVRQYSDFLFDMTPDGVTTVTSTVGSTEFGPGTVTKELAVAISDAHEVTFIERGLTVYGTGKQHKWYRLSDGNLEELSQARNVLIKSSSLVITSGQIPKIEEKLVERPLKRFKKNEHTYDNDALPSEVEEYLDRLKRSSLVPADVADEIITKIDECNVAVLEELLALKFDEKKTSIRGLKGWFSRRKPTR